MKDFSTITRLLTTLLKKNVSFQWNEACQCSFERLKEALTTSPVLALLIGNGGYIVYTDSLRQGFGCILMQTGKVIAYASRQLQLHEMN